MFLLGHIRNAVEKATITEEPILLDARLAICLYRLARHSRKRNCLCTAHARQGGGGGGNTCWGGGGGGGVGDTVWQMRESYFL